MKFTDLKFDTDYACLFKKGISAIGFCLIIVCKYLHFCRAGYSRGNKEC